MTSKSHQNEGSYFEITSKKLDEMSVNDFRVFLQEFRKYRMNMIDRYNQEERQKK